MAGYMEHIKRNFKRLLAKVANSEDQWSKELTIFVENIKKHSKLHKDTFLCAPLSIKRAYMNEIWLSELHPPEGVDTQELLNYIIEPDKSLFKNKLQEMAPKSRSDELESWFVQMENLYSAVNELFSAKYERTLLSEDLIQDVHKMVMVNVQPDRNAGTYRTVEVGAAGSSVQYEKPHNIAPRLASLIAFTNSEYLLLSNQTDKLVDIICLGGFFLSEFLLIHPFRDGNGRTSRLLLSHLLRGHTIVPVSLYLRSNRKHYIEVMQSRTSGTQIPLKVITYVAECVEETVLVSYREQLDVFYEQGILTDDESVEEEIFSHSRIVWIAPVVLFLLALMQR
jgi:fido (protein-threonine AMPylation protein)